MLWREVVMGLRRVGHVAPGDGPRLKGGQHNGAWRRRGPEGIHRVGVYASCGAASGELALLLLLLGRQLVAGRQYTLQQALDPLSRQTEVERRHTRAHALRMWG